MKNFVCPKCGYVIKNDLANNRQLCPTCARERKRERDNARNILVAQEEYKGVRLDKPSKLKQVENEQEREERRLIEEAKKEADEKLDARTRAQMKQCRKCEYHARAAGGYEFCDHVTKTGKLRDRGQGVGKCGSFAPMKKETKEERITRSREALLAIEANNAQNTGEKMRKVN